MEWLFIIGFIVWVIYQANKDNNSTNSFRDTPPSNRRSSPNTTNRRTSPPTPKPPRQTYRPQARSAPSRIKFKSPSDSPTQATSLDSDSLKDLHDAFTGAELDISLGLFQCLKCRVFYHQESVTVLKEANNSQCVSCQSTNIVSVHAGKDTSGRNYRPDVVTLENYKKHVGSVVTFRGYVHAVRESKRGNDFAVMFENKSWTNGFKLVFFRGAVNKVGGRRFIFGLKNKTLEVRGLIVKHSRFGYEIIVSERSMIMSIEQ